MEPNILHIEKQLAEYIEFYHFLSDLNCDKMNVSEEIKLKEISRE